ncbi:hypothetical protein KIK06_28145 [Nocardiopsis sp. EMB25]|uniref:VOC family protein n=1 Tax=Nocardiopsis sp. EMB25 TaxID=2835867 RepID=UPI002284B8E4|nr:VOC family protein [Nocardiopsis sp. EMB25]MCY9787755.1 hypothetical protein [Nocardiopsis sp. EMB25]
MTVGPPSRPDVNIVLEPPPADPNASEDDQQAMAEPLAKGLPRGVVFATGDCAATFERISGAGAEVLQEPMDQPCGVRDRAFRDPFGTMPRFTRTRGQPVRDPTRDAAAVAPRAGPTPPVPPPRTAAAGAVVFASGGILGAVDPPPLRTVFHG